MRKGHIFVGLQFLILTLLVFSPSSEPWLQLQKLVGNLAIICGAIGIIVAMRQLGDALTAMPESKPEASLVTSGLYKYVRHPIYSFLILAGLGITLTKSSFLSAATFITLVVLLNFKYRYEDALLRSKWQQAEEYQRRTPAVFPRLLRRSLFLPIIRAKKLGSFGSFS